MARIRSIKPDFFRHSGLYRLEVETGLPIRVAFAGLWTAADRAGRFKWDPDTLKLDALPFDQVDFSRVLDALATRGHIRKYVSNGREYGWIPSWDEHQVINNRESASTLPDFHESEDVTSTCTRESRVEHAQVTRLVHAQVEGKGREGEEEGKEIAPKSPSAPRTRPAKSEAPSTETWNSYAEAYAARYGTDPVRNAKVNGQLSQLVGRLGPIEAPSVAAFYVGHQSAHYVRSMHAVGLLLQDAEKLRTEWATGRRITMTQAMQRDRTATNGGVFQALLDEAEAGNGH